VPVGSLKEFVAMLEISVLPRKGPAHKGVRLLLALFLVVATTAFALVVVEHTAQAATCAAQKEANGYHIPNGCSSVPIPAAHHCMVVGTSNDGTTQGVECADLYATNSAQNEFDVWGEGEFYCQGSHPRCLGMNVEVWFSITVAGIHPATTTNGTYKCNTTSPACPNGGQAAIATTHWQGFGPVPANYCVVAQSFEPADGAIVTTAPNKNYTNSEVISINGASAASHARAENLSNNETVCIDS
jgi:hypothetical protein